jgi:hypothetical protein
MLDFLKPLKDEEYDAFFFLPGESDEQIHIELNHYKNPGEKIKGSEIGDWWHIVLFKEGEEGDITNLDNFEAILGCPLEYASTLIPNNWNGMIAKKTTTSDAFVEKLVAKLKSVC